jgi:hypothetical protein
MSAPEFLLSVARASGEGQQNVSVTTSSAQTTNAIGASTCLVYTNVECFVVAGADPTATVAIGTPLAAGQMIRLKGIRASDKLAFIAATGSGTVYLRPGA